MSNHEIMSFDFNKDDREQVLEAFEIMKHDIGMEHLEALTDDMRDNVKIIVTVSYLMGKIMTKEFDVVEDEQEGDNESK